ncbi:cyclic nucleotide-binding domain-containing protein [Wenzhouxiangella sp. XN24]|uniref:Crp/Fnr family transcriptional regulator n=1 Tax=Wenzhouxiangella sp. XN24 TaxID=2713569 RepID=UPI0013E9C224|nr:cyclic nucleotide-binding domain-containing protein [Wenzhouxiangella sp. XN24]NGX15365.1 cyclic nucleotide-binding domain-containing protein [Wenzhouxiangella sp. XN24]
MTKLDKSEAVARSILGAELEPEECTALAEKIGLQEIRKGELVVREGEARRTLFVLADGKMSVCKADGKSETCLYQLRNGECAGTRAFLDGSERKAMLRADTDGVVLTLEPEDFEQLIESHPRLVYKVMKALFRVTHTNLMRMNLESAELRNYMMKTGGRY